MKPGTIRDKWQSPKVYATGVERPLWKGEYREYYINADGKECNRHKAETWFQDKYTKAQAQKALDRIVKNLGRVVPVDPSTRWCSICKEVKPLEQFQVRRTRGGPYISGSWCDHCRKAYCIAHNRGVSVHVYLKMVKDSGGRCEICEQPSPSLWFDHCHATGKHRGLICSSCNAALGMMRDDPKVFKRAARYINKYAKRIARVYRPEDARRRA